MDQPVVGVVRIEERLARCVIQHPQEAVRFCRFDKASGTFQNVTPDQVVARINLYDRLSEKAEMPLVTGKKGKAKERGRGKSADGEESSRQLSDPLSQFSRNPVLRLKRTPIQMRSLLSRLKRQQYRIKRQHLLAFVQATCTFRLEVIGLTRTYAFSIDKSS